MTCCILPDLVQIDGLFLIFWSSGSSSSLAGGHAGKDSSKDCRCLFMSSQGVWEVWSVIEPGCGSASADCLDVLEEVLECLWWSNHMLTYVHWIKVWILWVLTPESTSRRANDVLHSAWLGSDWWTVLRFFLRGCCMQRYGKATWGCCLFEIIDRLFWYLLL